MTTQDFKINLTADFDGGKASAESAKLQRRLDQLSKQVDKLAKGIGRIASSKVSGRARKELQGTAKATDQVNKSMKGASEEAIRTARAYNGFIVTISTVRGAVLTLFTATEVVRRTISATQKTLTFIFGEPRVVRDSAISLTELSRSAEVLARQTNLLRSIVDEAEPSFDRFSKVIEEVAEVTGVYEQELRDAAVDLKTFGFSNQQIADSLEGLGNAAIQSNRPVQELVDSVISLGESDGELKDLVVAARELGVNLEDLQTEDSTRGAALRAITQEYGKQVDATERNLIHLKEVGKASRENLKAVAQIVFESAFLQNTLRGVADLIERFSFNLQDPNNVSTLDIILSFLEQMRRTISIIFNATVATFKVVQGAGAVLANFAADFIEFADVFGLTGEFSAKLRIEDSTLQRIVDQWEDAATRLGEGLATFLDEQTTPTADLSGLTGGTDRGGFSEETNFQTDEIKSGLEDILAALRAFLRAAEREARILRETFAERAERLGESLDEATQHLGELNIKAGRFIRPEDLFAATQEQLKQLDVLQGAIDSASTQFNELTEKQTSEFLASREDNLAKLDELQEGLIKQLQINTNKTAELLLNPKANKEQIQILKEQRAEIRRVGDKQINNQEKTIDENDRIFEKTIQSQKANFEQVANGLVDNKNAIVQAIQEEAERQRNLDTSSDNMLLGTLTTLVGGILDTLTTLAKTLGDFDEQTIQELEDTRAAFDATTEQIAQGVRDQDEEAGEDVQELGKDQGDALEAAQKQIAELDRDTGRSLEGASSQEQVDSILQKHSDRVDKINERLAEQYESLNEKSLETEEELLEAAAEGRMQIIENENQALSELEKMRTEAEKERAEIVEQASIDVLKQSGQAVGDIVSAFNPVVGGLIKSLTGPILDLLTSSPEELEKALEALIEGIAKVIAKIIENLPKLVISLINAVIKALPKVLRALLEGIVNAFISIGSFLIDFIKNPFGGLGGFFDSLLGADSGSNFDDVAQIDLSSNEIADEALGDIPTVKFPNFDFKPIRSGTDRPEISFTPEALDRDLLKQYLEALRANTSAIDRARLLEEANALNPFIAGSGERRAVELLIQIGDQKLADILLDLQEAGFQEVAV